MRKVFIALSLIMSFAITANAQQANKVESTPTCSDLKVHSQLVALNKDTEDKGYKMVYFNSENIPSKTLMSVRLECKAGESYVVNYVLGNKGSKYQLNVIDNNVSQIVKEKGKVLNDNLTVITENFTAKTDGVYVLIYAQQTKENNCVGLSVHKK